MSVIGLMNMAEDVNLAQWKGFLGDITQAYAGFVHPVWAWMFSWLALDIPTLVWDYAPLGIIVGGATLKGARGHVYPADLHISTVRVVVINLLIWPILLLYFLALSTDWKGLDSSSRSIIAWVAATLATFVFLLALNVAVRS